MKYRSQTVKHIVGKKGTVPDALSILHSYDSTNDIIDASQDEAEMLSHLLGDPQR
jgi:hypothetical protein